MERAALLQQAVDSADSSKQRLLALGGRVADTLKSVIIESYVLELLAEG